MSRESLLEKSVSQAIGDTKFNGETEKAWNEFEEIRELFQRRKKKEEVSRVTKDLMAFTRKEGARMNDVDRLKKSTKELFAKLEEIKKDKKFVDEGRIDFSNCIDEKMNKAFLHFDRIKLIDKEVDAKFEEVEKDMKFAVKSRIELMKILDEERKKVSCLEEKCVNLETQKIAYLEREITYKSKILEEKEKLEIEREKNRALEEEVVKYKRLMEGLANVMKFANVENKERKEVRKEDEEWAAKVKVYIERVASLTGEFKKVGQMEMAGSVKNTLETTYKPIDGNTNEYEDTMFGSEDDTVYVDFDQVIGNF